MRKKLTKKQKECVRKWLNILGSEKEWNCPFGNCKNKYPHSICKSWFPKTNKSILNCPCPCYCYHISTVIKRAKEMIK